MVDRREGVVEHLAGVLAHGVEGDAVVGAGLLDPHHSGGTDAVDESQRPVLVHRLVDGPLQRPGRGRRAVHADDDGAGGNSGLHTLSLAGRLRGGYGHRAPGAGTEGPAGHGSPT